jgi:hypothetical protein
MAPGGTWVARLTIFADRFDFPGVTSIDRFHFIEVTSKNSEAGLAVPAARSLYAPVRKGAVLHDEIGGDRRFRSKC